MLAAYRPEAICIGLYDTQVQSMNLCGTDAGPDNIPLCVVLVVCALGRYSMTSVSEGTSNSMTGLHYANALTTYIRACVHADL